MSEGTLGFSVLRFWLFFDRFFGFCAKWLLFIGFGVRCGLRIFRFLASGFSVFVQNNSGFSVLLSSLRSAFSSIWLASTCTVYRQNPTSLQTPSIFRVRSHSPFLYLLVTDCNQAGAGLDALKSGKNKSDKKEKGERKKWDCVYVATFHHLAVVQGITVLMEEDKTIDARSVKRDSGQP